MVVDDAFGIASPSLRARYCCCLLTGTGARAGPSADCRPRARPGTGRALARSGTNFSSGFPRRPPATHSARRRGVERAGRVPGGQPAACRARFELHLRVDRLRRGASDDRRLRCSRPAEWCVSRVAPGSRWRQSPVRTAGDARYRLGEHHGSDQASSASHAASGHRPSGRRPRQRDAVGHGWSARR